MLMLTLKSNDVDIWAATLNIEPSQEQKYLSFLNQDEILRANRFHFSIHRQRFIAARGILRKLLGKYLNLEPQKIEFTYGPHNKPFLHFPSSMLLQFNLAHSDEMAIFAFTKHHAIGIDIEKIEDKNHDALARRFFSDAENQYLIQLPHDERIRYFYYLWSRKEALIKAVGKGLSIPLSSFSVISSNTERFTLENKSWHLESIAVNPHYAAAFAIEDGKDKVTYREFAILA